MRNELDFWWDVHAGGYTWVESTAVDSDKVRKYLTTGHPLGSPGFEFKRYAPLDRHTGLFRTFAEVDPNEEAIKAFADSFGHLGDPIGEMIGMPNHVSDKGQLVGTGESFGKWTKAILNMRRLVELWNIVQHQDLAALARHIRWHGKGVDYLSHPDLVPNELPAQPSVFVEAVIAAEKINPDLLEDFQKGDLVRPALYYLQNEVNRWMKGRTSSRLLWTPDHSKLKLCLVPESLFGALWLQFAQVIERNSEFRRCAECGTWFELRPGSARSDKIYCSNSCRTKALRRRKAKAKELSKQGFAVREIAARLETEEKTVTRWLSKS